MSVRPELVLRSESLEVVILPELGARIHRIRAFGHDLLRTPDDPGRHAVDPFFWGAYPMAPWCNRAPAGERDLAGQRLDLRANFTDGSAIHGLVFAEPWDLDANGRLAITRGGASEQWPWRFEVSMEASVDNDTVVLDYRLTNLSDAPMPAGIGLHPWFRRPIELRLPGDRVYTTNFGSPSEPDPARGGFDLRTLAPPAMGLDATWTGLASHRIDIAWPRLGVSAALEVDTRGADTLVAVASPAAIDAVAIEPQTHGPDPLRRLERGEPDAPQLLDPGAELSLSVSITAARGAVTG